MVSKRRKILPFFSSNSLVEVDADCVVVVVPVAVVEDVAV